MTIKYTIEPMFSWDKKPIVKIGTIENIEDTPDRVSKALASLGKKCLDFIDNKEHALFKKSYRIEIVPVKHPQWEFQLYFPAEIWFDMLYYVKAKDAEEKNMVLAAAREYVNSVRSSYRPSIPEISLTPVLSRIYCATHADCISSKYPHSSLRYLLDKITNIISYSDNKTGTRHDTRYAEPNIFCRKTNVPQQSKKPTSCNWYAEDERVVFKKDKSYPSYVVLSRQDHVRELLVAPLEHKTNRELITYPVECYSINFGSWESETAKDKNALKCHAHFHIHLSKVVVHNMEQKKDINNHYYYPAIHGKINDPFQHRMKDCVELETLRLSSLEINANYNNLRKQIEENGKQIEDNSKKIADNGKKLVDNGKDPIAMQSEKIRQLAGVSKEE
ncbi:hypothetical protein GLOIN_2v1782595 [Rhizophagus clarus]|uniref:Uncharacterized protein n=1 Tax=Rhizophagus clarus TaxID=94130 RepID=A0A8H3L7F7_9GLOM|nr:hypothetical protein GLOIN_2v1782595 [Rhizophagus clarus]